MPDTPIRVLYIMGAGRSGSTVVGVTLGNCPGLFYAGELDAWLRKSAVPNFGGEERERFWARVRADVPGAEQLFGEQALRALEHSTSILRPWRRSSMRARYRAVQRDLFRAIVAQSGRTWTVDSGHYPLRARELRAIPDLDVRLVLLVRNPSSVVASFGRREINQPSKSFVAANAYLWLTHLVSLFVYLTHPATRRQLVRFEDFVADPAAVTQRILRNAGAPTGAVRLDGLSTGPAFQGNRLLRKPTITLEPATSTPPRSWPTTIAQAPWLLAYALLARRSAH